MLRSTESQIGQNKYQYRLGKGSSDVLTTEVV